ncbi:MAG: SulP family inorganic anion transporter [Candidatus Krumholzibacteria bacterium]|nr:SulP family inorganic anion transporter [Candidatus Krumholzibacteria bacterium]
MSETSHTNLHRLQAWMKEESVYFSRPVRVWREFQGSFLRSDLVAGLTVAVVLLPQAMAYAMIAELPPQMGLYAAIVAAIVGALWGSSHHLHTGPTNAASLLVLASLLTVAQPGTPEFLAAAGYMAIIVGVFRLVMGLLRMGVLVNFVADSVIVGFTAGAGLLISVNQLRHLLRVDIISSPEMGQTLHALYHEISAIHLPSLGLGLGVIVIIALLKRFRPHLPAALIGMVLAAAVTALFDLEAQGVLALGAIPRSLPPFADLPFLDFQLIWNLTPGALAVAAIGLVEAMSISRSVASQTGQRLDSNQEFVGQGLASIFSGFLSGYAVSGSFTRTAVNHGAGARSPMASVFSGLWVLVAMILLAPLAVYLPRAALAGVLLVTAWGMVDRQEMRRVVRTSKGDTWIMGSTLAATIMLPLEFAVLAGMLVSFARYLIKTSTPGVYAVVPDENFRHFIKAKDTTVCPQLGVMEIEGSLYFGAANHIEEVLRENQEANPGQIFLLLRMHMVDICDVSGIHMLEAVVRRYRKRGGDVFLEGVRPGVLHMIGLYGFQRMLGSENILNTDNAISHIFHKVLHPGFCVYECKDRVFGECQALPKDSHAANLPELSEIPEHRIQELGPSEVRFLMSDPNSELVVIDVGEAGEYRDWHIEGSYSLPLRRLTAEGPGLPRESGVVFVSRMGRRSSLAVHIMQDLGHEKTFNLRGGMLAWEAAGFPIAVE